MGPSFSSKDGGRYRFYISMALRGRKHTAGSVARIAAHNIEGVVEESVRKNLTSADASDQAVSERIERAVISKSLVCITFTSDDQADGSSVQTLEIPWAPTKASRTHLPPSDDKPDQKLLQAVVRAHAWLADLQSGRCSTIEELATAAKIHLFAMRPLCFTNDPVEDRAAFRQTFERADFVSAHEAALALDIRCEDCDEFPADCRRV